MDDATATVCPACSFEQRDGGAECARCGVVFTKAQAIADAVARTPAIEISVERDRPPKASWVMVGVAFGAAALAHAIPVTRFLLSPLVTLLHEFGHAVAAWLLGCPAIPAFDFVYGGGVTHQHNFQLPLAVAVGGVWAWLGWTFRRNPRTLAIVATGAVLWLVACSAEWRREIVIASMGHGGEAILAGILLYMALTGVGWRMPSIERPLGAFAAFFVLFRTTTFAWQIRNDAEFLAWYRGGKGGALMNDLEVVALDVRIWTGAVVDIERVAGWLLVAAPIPAVIAVLAYLGRERVAAWSSALRQLGRT